MAWKQVTAAAVRAVVTTVVKVAKVVMERVAGAVMAVVERVAGAVVVREAVVMVGCN